MRQWLKRTILLFWPFVLLLSVNASAQEACEGNFDCDQDVDGADTAVFKVDFGRSIIVNPCSAESPCNGDFNCDRDCDGTDAARFKRDFGRSVFNSPCPACLAAPESCNYSATTTTCSIDIPLNRSCPDECTDDPPYRPPGRMAIPATCNDIIDFTVCTDCPEFDPACLMWAVSPAAPWLTLGQIDDCCWRLTIGDSCEQIEKIATYTVTVTDICNDTSDSVEIQIGKILVGLGDAILPRGAGSAFVDVNLINPYHAVRAITLDVAECDGGNDKLECSMCVIDSDRTLSYTCAATEQEDGSCRMVLYSTDPLAVITQGTGTVARILYVPGPDIDPCGECVHLCPRDIQMSDQYNDALCACALCTCY